MSGREEKTYHGSTYHNWSEASGFGHFEQWLTKEQELRLHDVIDLLIERGYQYYEEVAWIASSVEYVASYARGEDRIVTFGPQKFFVSGVTVRSLLADLAHTQIYLRHEQAEHVVSEIQEQFPGWHVQLFHASSQVRSISPAWDEWRVVAEGIYKGKHRWQWTVSEPDDWPVMCATMERDHQVLYTSLFVTS